MTFYIVNTLASKPSSPAKSTGSRKEPGPSRMRQRFNELMDDAFTLFGSVGSSPNSHDTYTVDDKEKKQSQSQGIP